MADTTNLVVGVHYSDDPVQIQSVKTVTNSGLKITHKIMLREELVKLIESGVEYKTATMTAINNQLTYIPLAVIETFKTDNGTFIRTKGNDTTCDNLGEIYEFQNPLI